MPKIEWPTQNKTSNTIKTPYKNTGCKTDFAIRKVFLGPMQRELNDIEAPLSITFPMDPKGKTHLIHKWIKTENTLN